MNKLVKNIEVKNSELKHETFKDDFATEKMFSVVQAVPIPDQKVLKLTLEGGDVIIIPGEIIDTSGLNPGEKKLAAVDSSGNEKISITLHNTGKIEIKGASDDMVKLIVEIAQLLSTTTVATALGSSPLSTQANFVALLAKLKLFEVINV